MFDDKFLHNPLYVAPAYLFRETFEVDILPGIYIYNFKFSDNINSDKDPANNDISGLAYYGNVYGESDVYFDDYKLCYFEPYTLYYIKQ